MGRLLSKQSYRDILLGLGLLLAALALVAWPGESMSAMKDGLQLCGNVILPSLFPFFVLSSLVVELGMARYLGRALEKIMWPLFRVNGACVSALVLGFVGGYPVGARTAIRLYETGACSRTEAQRLLAFCNNSGPAFILGVVGTGIFSSGRIGLMLYLTHIAASLCVGLLFRFYRREPGPARRPGHPPQFQAARFSAAFIASVKGALMSMLNICAFVVFFTVVIRLLFLSGVMEGAAGLVSLLLSPLGLDRSWTEKLLIGLLEVSSGVASLSGPGALTGRVSMAAFMLGWAGLSVHCQVLSFVGDSGLSVGPYLGGKLLHGAFSAVFILLLTRLFPLEQPVSSYLSQQVETLAALDFHRCIAISAVTAFVVWLAFLALSARAARALRTAPTRCRRSPSRRRG